LQQSVGFSVKKRREICSRDIRSKFSATGDRIAFSVHQSDAARSSLLV
jgi:hypothetical protein